MALANFFDKIALGASQILNGFDRKEFEEILLSHRIQISFDENATSTIEGRATLDLLVRFIARLYPVIQIENVYDNTMVEDLKNLAKRINPAIEFFDSGEATIYIVVGNTPSSKSVTTFYIGSDHWITHFSSNKPVGSSQSNNPFGAGTAACFGAANVFRTVFQKQLPYGNTDSDFSLSLLDFSISSNCNDLAIQPLDFNEVVIVGLGAIGNGIIWSLRRLDRTSGSLVMIDDEAVALSNLQRYILTDQDSIDVPKVELMKSYLGETDLAIISEPIKFDEYIVKRNNWNVDTILSCVDNAIGRIEIQGILPKIIFNGWTQQENIGISRHTEFGELPCLCCLYYPTIIKKSRSQEIADNLNMSSMEGEIRKYLANNIDIDEGLIQKIAGSNEVKVEDLNHFTGKSLNVFYSEAVCGGVLMKLRGGKVVSSTQDIEVPSAFESALAGILLGAELIKNKLGHISPQKGYSTRFNLMRPITQYLNFPEEKKDNCICCDSVYLNVYAEKWVQ